MSFLEILLAVTLVILAIIAAFWFVGWSVNMTLDGDWKDRLLVLVLWILFVSLFVWVGGNAGWFTESPA